MFLYILDNLLACHSVFALHMATLEEYFVNAKPLLVAQLEWLKEIY